jgi:Retinoic acid induced 16-like protein
MVKIARNSPSMVATEIVRCLVALIDVSDEETLAHETVCVPISELAGSFHAGLDDEYREALMELLFNVAATTKVRKSLLNLWFNLNVGRDVGSEVRRYQATLT